MEHLKIFSVVTYCFCALLCFCLTLTAESVSPRHCGWSVRCLLCCHIESVSPKHCVWSVRCLLCCYHWLMLISCHSRDCKALMVICKRRKKVSRPLPLLTTVRPGSTFSPDTIWRIARNTIHTKTRLDYISLPRTVKFFTTSS